MAISPRSNYWDRQQVEDRPVCRCCGQINGTHLDKCRIAELERELIAANLRINELERAQFVGNK